VQATVSSKSGPVAVIAVLVVALSAALSAQVPGAGSPPPASAPAAAPAQDTLGRTTPRGTVRGFLGAARRDEFDLARQYLNTRGSAERASELARQLFVVLDTRLTDLTQVSDAPEGSQARPDTPGLEVIGSVRSDDGPIDIVLEQRPGTDGAIWLFSAATLKAVPDIHHEIALASSNAMLPARVTSIRFRGIRLIEWAVMLIGLGLLYPATVLLNRALTASIRRVRRQSFERSTFAASGVLPVPTRLLLMAIGCRLLLQVLPFSLLSRQFWLVASSVVMIIGFAWLAILITGEVEHSLRRRMPAANGPAATSLLRVGRRSIDLVVVLVASFAMLRRFGVDPTPALAGLGVGGIAVALAAQKTLENVIAGASLIFDGAVQVGDFLRMGQTTGTVEHIGLRSTRIRTLDRTLVSVPNSQIANTAIETLSARDKFWFHPVISLRYETTPDQMQTIVAELQRLLSTHAAIDPSAQRVRFHNLGAFSLDIEVSAYFYARDWGHFMELQEQLLLTITKIVEEAGTSMAFPSQTLYIAGTPAAADAAGPAPVK
jgi:MscS family membrane protein